MLINAKNEFTRAQASESASKMISRFPAQEQHILPLSWMWAIGNSILETHSSVLSPLYLRWMCVFPISREANFPVTGPTFPLRSSSSFRVISAARHTHTHRQIRSDTHSPIIAHTCSICTYLYRHTHAHPSAENTNSPLNKCAIIRGLSFGWVATVDGAEKSKCFKLVVKENKPQIRHIALRRGPLVIGWRPQTITICLLWRKSDFREKLNDVTWWSLWSAVRDLCDCCLRVNRWCQGNRCFQHKKRV